MNGTGYPSLLWSAKGTEYFITAHSALTIDFSPQLDYALYTSMCIEPSGVI